MCHGVGPCYQQLKKPIDHVIVFFFVVVRLKCNILREKKHKKCICDERARMVLAGALYVYGTAYENYVYMKEQKPSSCCENGLVRDVKTQEPIIFLKQNKRNIQNK